MDEDQLNVTGMVPRPWGRETGDPELPFRCDWCGESFRPPKATGRVPRYCRRSCRQRAFEARQTRREVSKAVARTLVSPRNSDSSRDESESGQAAPVLPGLELPE